MSYRAHDHSLLSFRALERVEDAVVAHATRPQSAQPSSERLPRPSRIGLDHGKALNDRLLNDARKGPQVFSRASRKK